MKPFTRLLFMILSLVVLLPASPGAAQSTPESLSISVQAGFEGYYKEKTWMPVTIWLENTGAPIEGVLEITLDDYIQPDVTYTYPIELPTTSRKQINLTVYPEVTARAVQVKLLAGKQVLGKAESALIYLDAGNPLFGVLSASPSNFSILTELDTLGEFTGSAAVALLDSATFPTRSQALGALNVLVLCNANSSGEAVLSPAQVQALQAWTAGGGRLVIAGGPSWRKTTAGLESSGLLPLIPSGERILTDLQPLLAYLRQGQLSTPVLETHRLGIVVTEGILQPQARTLVSAETSTGAVPWVVQMDYGAGNVTFLAFDPTLEPFASWDGLVTFYRQLLGTPLNKPAWLGGFQDWYAAQNAAQSLPGISLPPTWLVMGVLGLYILLLGPANYVLLRLLKRRELGWLTLPATVILSALLVFVVGSISRSEGALVGRLSMMQIYPGVETAPVHSLVSLYSPNRATYEIELPAPALIHRIPNDPPAPQQALTATQDFERMRISGLHLDSGSLAPFAVESIAAVPNLIVTTHLDLFNDQVLLSGKITNQSEITLQTAVVHTPAGSEELGTIGPGQYAEFSVLLSRLVSLQQPQPVPIPPYNYPIPIASAGIDAIIGPILGTSNYYQEQEAYWRYQMLFSALGGYNSIVTNLGGLFLTAWSEVAPYEIALPEKNFRTHDATLYVVKLQPELTFSRGTLTLTPGIFSRRMIENTMYSGTPYYLYAGQYLVFEDTPIVPLTYTHLTSLTVDLSSTLYSGTIQEFSIALWDDVRGEWVDYPNPVWGPNLVPDAARLVSPAGAVRIKVEGLSAQGAQLDRIDISLVIEH